MTTVTIRQAKANFSKLIARVCKGEEIVLVQAGKPVAKIVPFEAAPQRRESGSARGQFTISDDFDAPLPDKILDAFEGKA
jgi:prevent-host-death family protein